MHMLALLFTSANEKRLGEIVREAAGRLRKAAEGKRWRVIGPADAAVGKINDVYRKMIYIRHEDYGQLVSAKDFMEALMEEKKKEYGDCSIYFDFDPMNGY